MPEKSDLSVDYCVQQARQLDFDRYLATLFAPSDKRLALVSILAWNLEVAKTRDSVSEPMLGHIRLQWWREAIAEIYDGKELRQHPVVTTLAEAIGRFSISQSLFETLLSAREKDMEDTPPKTLTELVTYAEETCSPVFSMWGQILARASDPLADETKSLGISWALIGILRAVPYNASRRRCWLPHELLREHGVTQEDLFAPRKKDAIANVLRSIADTAEEHLKLAREMYRSVPKATRSAFLPTVLARAYLRKLHQHDFDLSRLHVDISPLGKQIRVMKTRWLTGL